MKEYLDYEGLTHYDLELKKYIRVLKDGLNLSVYPENSGTVSSEGRFVKGNNVTVTAIPNETHVFAGWYENDVLVSSTVSYTFKVDDSRNLVAKFELINNSLL